MRWGDGIPLPLMRAGLCWRVSYPEPSPATTQLVPYHPPLCLPSGLTSSYDAPRSLPCIAPRALLVAMGGVDSRCPLQGVWSVKGKGGARGALTPARLGGAVVLSTTQQGGCMVAAVADLPMFVWCGPSPLAGVNRCVGGLPGDERGVRDGGGGGTGPAPRPAATPGHAAEAAGRGQARRGGWIRIDPPGCWRARRR